MIKYKFKYSDRCDYNMKDLFSIGEVAKLFHINIRTLRYYDDIGLLKPEFVDPKTNYRYYSTNQFERLNTIKYLRALDVSLEQILTFFEHREVDTMLSIFLDQKQKVEKKKQELELIEKKISYRINQLQNALNTPNNEITIKKLPKRNLVVLKKEFSTTENLEHLIRDLERNYNLDSVIFLGKVGVSIASENLYQGNFKFYSSIFVVLESGDECEKTNAVLEEGNYASICYRGTHAESAPYYQKLMNFIQSNHYQITGDSVEITIIDSGMTNDSSKFITELQIPFNA